MKKKEKMRGGVSDDDGDDEWRNDDGEVSFFFRCCSFDVKEREIDQTSSRPSLSRARSHSEEASSPL
jgi:hypothetical protein